MTTVVNKYKVDMSDPNIVYIGRGSLFGNPFVMQNRSDEERARVIEEYRHWLWSQIQQGSITKEMLLELDGKLLCCFCAPLPCHGDVLVKAVEWAKKTTTLKEIM